MEELLKSIIDFIYGLIAMTGANPSTVNFANGFTIFFGGSFLCAGMGSLLAAGFLSVKTLLAMRWPTAPGVIVASNVTSVHSSDGTSYRANIVYQYQVGERTYQNDLVSFGAKNYSGLYGGAQRKANKYPPGTGVRVAYNPANPQKAVLEVSYTGGPLLIFLGVLFACIGIVGGVMGAMSGM